MTETAVQQPEAGTQVSPQKEHVWLQQLIGAWRWESTMQMAPGEPPVVHQGTETFRAVGDLWVVGEAGDPSDTNKTMIMTLGFDPNRGRFVGTFLAWNMAYLWPYDGGLDATEKKLTLESVGPSFEAEGETCPYRDVIELVADDHRTLTAHYLGKDGEWHEMMTTHYHRTS